MIGTKPFTEQYILAALIEQRLRDAGLSARRREGLGSSVIFDALRAGEIDVYVDYSGTIWANQMRRTDIKPRAEMLRRDREDGCRRAHGIVVLGGLGFENAYALAMAAQPRRRRSASAASPISASTRRSCRLPATTNSSAGRNGTRSARPMD